MEILVVGAGASGLMAAVAAARAGAKVTVLEKERTPGRKLCVTGNGKCNMTNSYMGLEMLKTHCPDYVRGVLEQFSQTDAIGFFSQLGIYTKNRDGWIYPNSGQASQVLAVLLAEASHCGVRLHCQTPVTHIWKEDGRFYAQTPGWAYAGDACVLACGSKAAPQTGADGSGYGLAQSLGHRILPVAPVLTGLHVREKSFRRLAGIRCDGRLSAWSDGEILASAQGELQFTSYGISGIPAFQVSHEAITAFQAGKEVLLSADLFPDYPQKALAPYLRSRIETCPYKRAEDFLAGLFHEKLCRELLLCAGIAGRTPVTDLAQEELVRLAGCIKGFSGHMCGFQDFGHAQACMGGVDLESLIPYTMESAAVPGLYFAGELTDVDGACGGYNLQWAWSSGYVAGTSAACRSADKGSAAYTGAKEAGAGDGEKGEEESHGHALSD